MEKTEQQKNPIRGGCLHCPGNHDILPLDTPIVAGFGSAEITKDGEVIYYEEPNTEFDDAPLRFWTECGDVDLTMVRDKKH